ncbi:SLATT domain-containing protein [Kocuria sp. APC 4018]|uniref:SLATT domain-containing protein n=1 Tax=unclassified Kocuria TaxID=2649579 RepID=UPI0025B550B4|nr:SLATT domain-containing protein [Kocuria sp. APC 4018]MDN3461559.1 SLATT domain-containing protein [Kocuria sp. APC 4018]WIW69422.1 SLATT domain-containing protein [Kocuria sp. ChxB]
MMGESQRAAIQAEVARVHESAVFSAQGQFEAAKAWRALHWTLGVLTAALSTLAAVLTFAADAQVASGILAVVAAIAAAVLTSSRPDKLAERAVARGNDYTTLRNDARRVLHVQVPNDEVGVLREALDGLAGRASDLDHTSDPIPRFAYNRAKRNIERDGGQQFEVDAS